MATTTLKSMTREMFGSTATGDGRATQKRAERLKAVAERIKQLYGVEDERSILQIAEAERELAQCEGCQGQCKKSPAFFQPRIEIFGGQAYASAMTCKFGEEIQRKLEFKRKCRAAGIPSIYVGKTFADYRVDESNREAVNFAKKAVEENLRGAFFYGKPGAGKTFLASLVAQEFLKAGRSVKFGNVPDLLNGFYAIYRGQSKRSERDLLDELYTVDLLVLDDFGLEKPTQFVGATLSKIIDARYNREDSTTLITSNHSLKKIANKLNNPTDGEPGLNGSRIYDRCIEICKTIFFKGNSRRK